MRRGGTNPAIQFSTLCICIYNNARQYPSLSLDILSKPMERGTVLSYRDHQEAQKKLIQTKKEALEAKRERLHNPRPPSYDPPPAGSHPLVFAALLLLLVLPLLATFLLVPRLLVAQTPQGELTLWVCSSTPEFERIKSWLEPEILANDLQWTIAHATDRYALVDMLRSGYGDLLIIDQEFAEELHRGQALVPLLDKLHWPTWDDCFVPFWEIQPFRKTFGWALPVTGNIDQARHLFIVMQQFAPPFTPELPPQQSL